MSILLLLFLLVLLFLTGYVFYQLYIHKWDFSALGKQCKNTDTSPPPPPPDMSSMNQDNMCTFLENDIATDNVYDNYGAKISKNIQVECSQCKEYVYKGQDGCALYSKDPFLDIKDRETGVNLSVCTALAFPRKCEEIFKSPPPPPQNSSSN
jgi:hypothetical protein